MTDPSHEGRRSLECRDLGWPCEWAARTTTNAELLARFAEHAKCAHAIDPLPLELAAKVQIATRTVS
jgi:predicted small metal-binding protein